MLLDGEEHFPTFVLEGFVAGDAVEDEDGFDGLRPVRDFLVLG